MDILQELGKSGLTILFSTHDPSASAHIAEYIIMLSEGKKFLADKSKFILTAENLTNLYGAKLNVTHVDESIIIYRESN